MEMLVQASVAVPTVVLAGSALSWLGPLAAVVLVLGVLALVVKQVLFTPIEEAPSASEACARYGQRLPEPSQPTGGGLLRLTDRQGGW
jgi:hypothetical protein